MANFGAYRIQRGLFVIEAAAQAALVGDHRVEPEVDLTHGDLRCAGLVVRQCQMVAAVAGQSQLEKRTSKARAGVNQCKQTARRHIEATEGAAQQANGFTHQPVVLMGQQHDIHRQHRSRIALGFDEPGANVQLIGTHLQDGIFQFSRHLQRIPGRTIGFNACDVGGLHACGSLDGPGGGTLGAVDLDRDEGIAQRIGFNHAGHGWQHHTLAICRTIALGGQFKCARFHFLREHLGLGDVIHQTPVFGLLSAHALDAGAEQVRQVMAHMFLVGYPRQAASAGEHTQQRHLGQAHSAGAVIHKNNFIASQRQFIAPPRTRPIDGRKELQTAEPG